MAIDFDATMRYGLPVVAIATTEVLPEKPNDGCRYCGCCGVILSRGILDAQAAVLVRPIRLAYAVEQMLEIASAPFRRGENWCYLCAYGADLAYRLSA